MQSVRIHWKLFTCCLNHLDSNFNYRLKTVLEPRVGYFFPAFIAHWTQPHSQTGSVRHLYQNTYFHEENTNERFSVLQSPSAKPDLPATQPLANCNSMSINETELRKIASHVICSTCSQSSSTFEKMFLIFVCLVVRNS